MSAPGSGKPGDKAKEDKSKEVALYITESTLKKAGFQRGATGWYYFSGDDDNTHIHLGAFTGPGVPLGSRRIGFVAFKVNDKGKGNIPQLGSGKYDGDQMPDCGAYSDAFREALEAAGII
jgi:hypothetical protein